MGTLRLFCGESENGTGSKCHGYIANLSTHFLGSEGSDEDSKALNDKHMHAHDIHTGAVTMN